MDKHANQDYLVCFNEYKSLTSCSFKHMNLDYNKLFNIYFYKFYVSF